MAHIQRQATSHAVTALLEDSLQKLTFHAFGKHLGILTASIPKADERRTNFKDLIATNPNYFGNAPGSGSSSVSPLSYDTSDEQLVCVGSNEGLGVLEATIEVKLPYGFLGGLCTNGSFEYVRFYVSYGDGWNDLGAVKVNTHDIQTSLDCNKEPDKPIYYVLTLPFQPSSQSCLKPVLPEIRAILSWDQLPPANSPFWPPVFGNAVDQHIQPQVSQLKSTKSSTTCHSSDDVVHNERSNSQKVVDHNPHYEDEQRLLSGETLSTPSLGGSSRPGVPRNLEYEELIGLGLDYTLNRLVAMIRIKQAIGYGGSLCQAGSLEYIAFWADWGDSCDWSYLGELTVNVHNISNIPIDGLTYSVVLPLDLRNVSAPCKVTKVARVRAALSWNTPPPAPPKVAVRGNWLETHVQLQPYVATGNPTVPIILTIGGVPLSEIDVHNTGMTFPGAVFADLFNPDGTPVLVDPYWPSQLRECPFGGSILITGPSIGWPSPSDSQPSQYQYRVVYRVFGDTSKGLPVLNFITVYDLTHTPPPIPPPIFTTWTPDSQGYLSYRSQQQNAFSLLSRWIPPDRGLYQIRLEAASKTSTGYTTVGTTDWYNIAVNDPSNPIGPTGTISFTNEPTCGTFPVGTILDGTFTAVSPYFHQYAISVIDSNVPVVVEGNVLPPVGPQEVVSPASWTWNSAGVVPCGYVVELRVWDRTIYNSFDVKYGITIATGFCVSPALKVLEELGGKELK